MSFPSILIRMSLTARKLSDARCGKMRRSLPCAKLSCLSSSLVATSWPEHILGNILLIALSENIRRQSLPSPGVRVRAGNVMSCREAGSGKSLSTSKRAPRTLLPFAPTETSGDISHVRRKAARRFSIPASMAASAGALAAFSRTVMARILADGARDSSASIRDCSSARLRIWVNGTGSRSLLVRLASTEGSSGYDLRMVVSCGSSRGISGGMLASVTVASIYRS